MSTSLDSITSRAASGLRASQAGIAVLSDNIANAGIAGYTAKRLELSTFLVGGETGGVRTGLVARSVDAAIQASVWSSASGVGSLEVRSEVLRAVNATQGAPEAGGSLADAVAGLHSSFTLLQAQPSGQLQQAAVVAAADSLARTINRTADAVTRERNGVQERIVTAVDALNAALETVQDTTRDLIRATGAGEDTAGLEDRRDAALLSLSGMMDLRYDKQANGDITILGRNGFSIPLDSRFSTGSQVLSPTSKYELGSTSIPAVTLQSGYSTASGPDVTGLIAGGELGELIQLRDKALPDYTKGLDDFSSKLAAQFNAQGLRLFTDGAGPVPPGGYVGLSSQIRVNPAVAALPSLVRDGSPVQINPATGPAGFSVLIDRVLNVSFAGSGASPSLAADAQAFVSRQSAAAAQADNDLAGAKAYYTTVSTRFADGAGVDVDREMGLMIQLQNSYQANARVFQTAQTLFNALLDATRVY